MNSVGQEPTFLDAQVGVNDSIQRAFSREKTKSFVSRNIEENVEDLATYKKRAEMLEKEESSTRKDISTREVLEDNNAREHGRVPPNSPNHDEFEFDCWDYFSSIFFQLFPDSGKQSTRPKSDGFCREKSLDMWKEVEWRASREKLRESFFRSEDSNGVFDDKKFSEGHTRIKFEESSRNEVKKKQPWSEQKRLKPVGRRYLTKKYSEARQNNRYSLVFPERPRDPFLQNRQRRKDAEMHKSMQSTYEAIKNLDFKKAEKKQTMSFTEDNTCSVYFPEPKQDRQSVPVRPLDCKANLIPRAVQRENTELSAVIKTAEEERGYLLDKTFDNEVKKYLVTCSFRLSNKKEHEQKSDLPKDVEKSKTGYTKSKFAKQSEKEVEDVGSKINKQNGVVFSPKVPEKDTKTRKSLFADKQKGDKMNKYRKDSKEQDSLEKSHVLELKTRQFEFPVFQKSEVLCHQVKRVTFAPLPILTSKVTYEKKDYDVWSRSDKKTVKPIEIKWKT